MRRIGSLLLAAVLAACVAPWQIVGVRHSQRFYGGRDGEPRVLGVIAHPDDETTFAAAFYKTATFLKGACDAVVITNGEGGFKYSTLAEAFYRLELTDEAVGRSELPWIRRWEFFHAASILGLRQAWFMDEVDHRYTQDVEEVLGPQGVWDLGTVHTALVQILERGDYDFVLTLAPTSETHAHHKAATILALRAVAALPAGERPVTLCVRTETEKGIPGPPTALEGYPETAIAPDHPPLVFDRTQRFGHRDALDYRVVVNLVIAAHKSQGTMQLAMNRGLREHFFLFAANPPDAAERAAAWMEALAAPQFPKKVYAESAGTNAQD